MRGSGGNPQGEKMGGYRYTLSSAELCRRSRQAGRRRLKRKKEEEARKQRTKQRRRPAGGTIVGEEEKGDFVVVAACFAAKHLRRRSGQGGKVAGITKKVSAERSKGREDEGWGGADNPGRLAGRPLSLSRSFLLLKDPGALDHSRCTHAPWTT